MPFTANRQFKKAPRLFSSAEGMHYTTVDGRKVIDGSAGLWCVNAGHGRRQMAAAVERQLMTLDFAPSFNMGHPLAFDFAERLALIAPNGIDRSLFTHSGSESVDTALKIALAYQRSIGQGTRTRLIGRERGYHGVGFGGMSVGGMVANRRAFATHLPGVDHIRHTHDLARNAFAKDQPDQGAELADDVERMVALHGADTIAAVIVEPVPGSTAVLPPPKGLPNVVDIRNVGLMGAVEVAPRSDGVGARGYDVMVDCFNRGLYLRMSGDSFALSPPLIVEKSHIDDIVSILGDAIKRVA